MALLGELKGPTTGNLIHALATKVLSATQPLPGLIVQTQAVPALIKGQRACPLPIYTLYKAFPFFNWLLGTAPTLWRGIRLHLQRHYSTVAVARRRLAGVSRPVLGPL